jgi:hypothetical protein
VDVADSVRQAATFDVATRTATLYPNIPGFSELYFRGVSYDGNVMFGEMDSSTLRGTYSFRATRGNAPTRLSGVQQFDDFVVAGAKMSADFSPIKLMRGLNISPNMTGTVSAVWELRLTEFNEVLEGNNADLIEGYSHLNKNQLKQCVRFCETVINDCNSYVQLKKVERKPRAKKAVSPEKLTRKFKFLKEFEELGLKSEAVTKLVGASEAWLYDTAKRKLIHVVADSHIGTFTVKGSAIVGFDALATVQKTLRKPAEQIRLVMGSKPTARKEFEGIKSTETKFTGRGNENMIILRAW